jgi:hypothetical protein
VDPLPDVMFFSPQEQWDMRTIVPLKRAGKKRTKGNSQFLK